MKMNAAAHADGLAKSNGVLKALALAVYYAEVTKPEELVNLPEGPVFMTKEEGGNRWKITEPKALMKTHNFWKNVEGVLVKRSGLPAEEYKKMRPKLAEMIKRTTFDASEIEL